MSCPVALLYVSISWLNLVAPSEAVKKMSFPLAWALVCKSGSVLLIRTGNSVSWPLTWVALTVIFFRYFHVPSAGSQVSQPWTAAVVPAGAQVWVPVAVLREMIQFALEVA